MKAVKLELTNKFNNLISKEVNCSKLHYTNVCLTKAIQICNYVCSTSNVMFELALSQKRSVSLLTVVQFILANALKCFR